MDNVLVDFESGIARLPAEIVQSFEGRLDEVPDIFSMMRPIDGAIGLARLCAACDNFPVTRRLVVPHGWIPAAAGMTHVDFVVSARRLKSPFWSNRMARC